MTSAMTGDYTDLRFVKARKVAQIVIEIPIEAAGQFVEMFGTPQPDKTVPVALARLGQPETLKEQLVASIEQERKGGPLAKAAGILCNEPAFWRYCNELYADMTDSPPSAALFVRKVCGIKSRAELDHNIDAAAKFRDLRASYEAWSRM